ncbi:MAG: hypothetical protein CM1200mP40_27580 [Gammaproteobacteria bacterium]|nr:MAG: hypothetical protein CM1200mP40_27580 [Gammaproteobacteria bacterium]
MLLLVISFLVACVASQPNNITNVCSIFEDRRGWYSAAKSAEDRWGIPIAVNMAFIYQESSFNARAKPDRTRVLWVIPGSRPSSAYGYAQALDGTWDDYRGASRNGGASRSDFDDSIDFFGWYNGNSRRIRIFLHLMPAICISLITKATVVISEELIMINHGCWMRRIACKLILSDLPFN